MLDRSPVLSICTSCRDGREAVNGPRGGTRLAHGVVSRLGDHAAAELTLRGVKCMSQCKRPCIASLSCHDRFTYIFGDIDPENADYIDALFELVTQYRTAPEGFVERRERPKALRSNILGRLPPIRSGSSLIMPLGTVSPVYRP